MVGREGEWGRVVSGGGRCGGRVVGREGEWGRVVSGGGRCGGGW